MVTLHLTDNAHWVPTEKQFRLLRCPVGDVLFGGTRGPGKTEGLCADWMHHAQAYGQHARGILIRTTYPELEEVEARCLQLYPAFGAHYNVQRKTWVWPSGATLRLRHLRTVADTTSYQGHSYTWFGVDELTTFPSLQPIDMLRATLRSSQGVPVFFRATANPGGPTHNAVKQRYIDPAPAGQPFDDTVTVADTQVTVKRVFISARLEDNPHLAERDPGDWDRVVLAAAGREDLLRAWRYGDWDIVAGGMFDDLWRPDIHIIPPFAIPDGWYVDRAHDWGSSAPFCTLWFAMSNGEQLPDGRSWPRGTIFVIREDYGWNGKPNEGLRLTGTAIAERVRAMEQALPVFVRPGPADDPIFEVRNGQSIADDMSRHGITWTRPSKGPGSRVTGWTKIRELLLASTQHPMEQPGLFVFDVCRHVIRTLPVLPRDEKKPDDVDSTAEDHAADTLRMRVLAPRHEATRLTMRF